MFTIGSFDAKTHFGALLERVAKGETIKITKRGVPVAKLVPTEGGQTPDLRKLAQEIRALRQGVRLDGLHIRDLINEGRRY
jgi:prevent-host-death family protein